MYCWDPCATRSSPGTLEVEVVKGEHHRDRVDRRVAEERPELLAHARLGHGRDDELVALEVRVLARVHLEVC